MYDFVLFNQDSPVIETDILLAILKQISLAVPIIRAPDETYEFSPGQLKKPYVEISSTPFHVSMKFG